MNAGASDRTEWKYVTVLAAVIVGWVVQSGFLSCLCHEGTVKMQMADGVDLLVLARLVLARIRRERGDGWIFYAVLPFLIIPGIMAAIMIWGPR